MVREGDPIMLQSRALGLTDPFAGTFSEFFLREPTLRTAFLNELAQRQYHNPASGHKRIPMRAYSGQDAQRHD